MLLGCVENGWELKPGAADTGALVTKMTGNYNIVDNALNLLKHLSAILLLVLQLTHLMREIGLVLRQVLLSKAELS